MTELLKFIPGTVIIITLTMTAYTGMFGLLIGKRFFQLGMTVCCLIIGWSLIIYFKQNEVISAILFLLAGAGFLWIRKHLIKRSIIESEQLMNELRRKHGK